ncbi:hypothetical protein FG385_31245 [Amycolatopsis alkalitolerans]|uniref:Uncharacterized protein n=1 Tax=Amycolatopsis alkalitolerans TaxID=2547244 RepID=A0A5C4LR28_9PSEU|nr:hypothetical protein FG385_31245 [Amycolatopsis alkalitolerans]
MDPRRLQDKEDVRNYLHKVGKEPKTPHHVQRAESVDAPSGAGSARLVGDGGRIELDPAEIAAADAQLGKRYDELSELLTQAKELGAPLRDGGGPVAAHLRKAFGVRGSDQTGVQATLREYLDELASLRDAIRRAGAGHEQQEEQARDAMAAIHKDTESGGTGR